MEGGWETGKLKAVLGMAFLLGLGVGKLGLVLETASLQGLGGGKTGPSP